MTTASSRIEQFKSDVSEMKLKTGTAGRDSVFEIVGLLMMISGVIVSLITYSASLNMDDARDVSSNQILSAAMVAMAVLGAALFVRYSIARFLRLWLLRQFYEDQANTERVVEAVANQR